MLMALLLQAAAPFVVGANPTDAAPLGAGPQSAGVAMKRSRVFEGVWQDSFEDQQFFDGATVPPDLRSIEKPVWIVIDRSRVLIDAKRSLRIPYPTIPHFYRVRFKGAEAQDMDCRVAPIIGPGPYCYGHFGMFPGLVVVEKMIAIKDLGPLTP